MINIYNKIMTGERCQQKANIYLNVNSCYNNPLIRIQTVKHIDLNNINSNFNNPKIIFCYTHDINILSTKIDFFMNTFILISHNSDHEIKNTNEVKKILANDKLKIWYAQNLLINHEKIQLLPIGFANSMWQHGNIEIFKTLNFPILKTQNTHTNKSLYKLSGSFFNSDPIISNIETS